MRNSVVIRAAVAVAIAYERRLGHRRGDRAVRVPHGRGRHRPGRVAFTR